MMVPKFNVGLALMGASIRVFKATDMSKQQQLHTELHKFLLAKRRF
jgi:hypothetical protein